MNSQVNNNIINLIDRSRDAIVCSLDDNGYPNAKCMFRIKNEGIHTFWFSTNTSAIRTAHWLKRPQASIYFVDADGFYGLMLTGQMQVYSDNETKKDFWREGDEIYYSLGPTDPDYSILCFKAEKGNYYHGLEKHLFDVAGEMEDK
ncbi:MAG: hypothetical protein K0S61_3913 [Anaerocolumna sp.]|jgi:general stress protein 26|nr:hypothetical protein [Anaerocolumna sp.]